jgi:hypothetical protein
MGWLNTLFDAGILAAQVSSMNKLETMKKQGAQAAALQAILAEIRRQIFNYKQEAEEILSMADQDPKLAAGALRILEQRLKASGITPDLFIDLSDKDYAASTIRLIRDNGNRLIAQLSPDEQTEVATVTAAAIRLPDYDYYTAHYADMQRYRAAEPLARKHHSGRGCLYAAIVIGCAWIGMGLCAFTGLAGGNTSSSGVFSGMGTGLMIGLAVGIGLIWYLSRGAQAAANAKKIVDEVKAKVDVEEFDALDKEFGGDYQRVVALLHQAQTVVHAFFGNDDTPGGAPLAMLSAANVTEARPAQAAATPPPTAAAPAVQSTAVRTTVYCHKCGTPNTVGNKFCLKCGQALIQ